MVMPEMDGIETTIKIRGKKRDALNYNIPIVAMTAHTMKKDRENCINAGMNDYISKPVEPKDLEKLIKK